MDRVGFSDIGGMLVSSVLKSNQMAQHIVADINKQGAMKANGGKNNKPWA